ncbi:MAG TPA: hypothetical protein PKE12_11285 [Kiritimatiellia bacterium]|nr:hypothetical protein [Kiritimatiellia bacterium]
MSATSRRIDFRHAPPSRWTCIGRPDDRFKTVVREDGALLYDYVHPARGGRLAGAFHTVIEFGVPADRAPLEITQRSDQPGNSIVLTTLRYPKATLTLSAFGHADAAGRRTDVVLWRIEARPGARQFAAALAVSPAFHRYRSSRVEQFPAVDAVRLEQAPVPEPVPAPFVIALSSDSYRRSGEPMDWYNFAAAYRIPPAGALSRMALLDAGEALEGAVLIPQGHAETAGMDYAWARRALQQERRFWRRQRIMRLPIEVPDPAVQDFLTACARNILQAREVRDGLPEFQVGPTCYRNLWVCDGYYLLQTARYLGLPDDAERGTQALLRRVQPDGSIADIPHHTMETIISVATLVRQAELSGDRAGLEQRWPVIQRALGYIRALRRKARALDPRAPEYGLLPRAYPDGGIGGIRAEYLTTLWTLAGLKLTARAARWLGRAGEADDIAKDLEALMTDFRAHAKRDLRTLDDGTPHLRMWMRGDGDHVTIPGFKGRLMPWQRLGLASGTWAFSQAIYTGEIFAPDDPLVRNLLNLFDRLDNAQGLPEGMGWLLDRSLWSYGPAFAAQVWLYAGRPDKAVDYLYAFANHAAPTRVWREEQSLDATGHGHSNGDMPHNWASAEFIQLVRNLLVVERGDGIELLSGLPPEWCRRGMRFRIEKTPTRFGPVTVRGGIDARGRGEITVRTDPAWPQRAAQLRMRLPLTARRAGILLNRKPVTPDAHRFILLPPASHHQINFQTS